MPLFERLAEPPRRRGPVLRRWRALRAGVVQRSGPTARASPVSGPPPQRRRRGPEGRARLRRRDRAGRGRRDPPGRLHRRQALRRPFVLWASVWSQPRSVAHAAALPMIRHIYRDADAVIAYGEHVRRFVAAIRGRDDDVFVAPQSVEPELFGRAVSDEEIAAFRARYGLGPGPLALYTGRLVTEKGIEVLIDAWPQVRADATLVLIGDGPLAARRGGDARRAPAGRTSAPRAAGRLRGRRADAGALDSDAALPGALGPRLQRGDAPGTSGDRHLVGGRGRRRARRGRAHRPGRAAGRRPSAGAGGRPLLADAALRSRLGKPRGRPSPRTPTTRWSRLSTAR